MNSSLETFAECLVRYQWLVDQVMAMGASDGYLGVQIQPELRAGFVQAVRDLDPAALDHKAFWAREVDKLAS